ncbi:hypothetical protein D1007_34472 [Hordeum vulgare]|nr:hypothetical protein D1007_34472 [Hordeum vulgare]
MRVKVTASDKTASTSAAPKPAGDNRGSQNNNNKRKADQLDSRASNKMVANVEGETPASQGNSQRRKTDRAPWQPRQSFEQMLDVPCKMDSGQNPSNHTLRQCSFVRLLSQGEGLPAPPPPGAGAAAHAPAPPLPPTHHDNRLHDDYPHQDGAFVVFTSEGGDNHSLHQHRREI